MGLFKRLTKSKNPDSKKFRREMAYAVSGQHIKYVTEKRDGVDEVIGRNGGLNIRNDEFIVYASADVVFRCPVDELQIWELLSRDGVVLTGPDLEHGGIERTVIAYYVYYRK
ncbi:MAG: hypothetical protein J6B72_06685 [Clostridia bacterium]|nr:hypothetical protein [Clostridia bacterium]